MQESSESVAIETVLRNSNSHRISLVFMDCTPHPTCPHALAPDMSVPTIFKV